MYLTKCDVCKKIIEEEQPQVSVAVNGHFSGRHLCGTCGKPVMKFLKSRGLIKASYLQTLLSKKKSK